MDLSQKELTKSIIFYNIDFFELTSWFEPLKIKVEFDILKRNQIGRITLQNDLPPILSLLYEKTKVNRWKPLREF